MFVFHCHAFMSIKRKKKNRKRRHTQGSTEVQSHSVLHLFELFRRLSVYLSSATPRISWELGSLSSDVFERRTSTGSEVFSLLTYLDDIKFVFLSFFTVIEAIWLKICAKPPSKNEKRPLPVDVRRSKTLLLKLPKDEEHPKDLITSH